MTAKEFADGARLIVPVIAATLCFLIGIFTTSFLLIASGAGLLGVPFFIATNGHSLEVKSADQQPVQQD